MRIINETLKNGKVKSHKNKRKRDKNLTNEESGASLMAQW